MGVTPSVAAGSPRRLDELDSLRGLAALSVVLLHVRAVWFEIILGTASPHQKHVADFFLVPFSRGDEAVVLFFILSGFVLAIPAIQLRAQPYSIFVIRRIFRIYFPYLAALTLAVVGNTFFFGDPTPCHCLRGVWNTPVDWHLVLQHVIFLGNYDTDKLNPPFWSLVIEMRVSFFFPLLCALALKLRPVQSLIMGGCLSGVAIAAFNLPGTALWVEPITRTLYFAGLFVVGIYLARERCRLSALFNRLSARAKALAGTLSIVLYLFGAYELNLRALPFTQVDLSWYGNWLTAMGVAGIMVFSLNSRRWSRALLWPPIHFLGKMSYSVYLLHNIVMVLFLQMLYGKLSSPVILGAAFVLVFPVSWAFYRWIELPSMNMGRRLSGYLDDANRVAVSL